MSVNVPTPPKLVAEGPLRSAVVLLVTSKNVRSVDLVAEAAESKQFQARATSPLDFKQEVCSERMMRTATTWISDFFCHFRSNGLAHDNTQTIAWVLLSRWRVPAVCWLQAEAERDASQANRKK